MTEIQNWEYGLHYAGQTFEASDGEDILFNLPHGVTWVSSDLAQYAQLISLASANNHRILVQYDIRRLERYDRTWTSEVATLQKAGIQYIQPSGLPNQKEYYDRLWEKESVIQRYYHLFSRFARFCANLGMQVVFPLLQPGGDFWDTVFLRAILSRLVAKKEQIIIDNLVLSANGATCGKPFAWGDGGARRWPEARPYHTPAGSEDQIGMNTWQWYQDIALDVLQKECPMFIFHTGNPTLSSTDVPDFKKILTMFPPRRVSNQAGKPSHLCLFDMRWMGDLAEAFDNIQEPVTDDKVQMETKEMAPKPKSAAEKLPSPCKNGPDPMAKWIKEYLFLPKYSWGVAEWHLDIVKPYIQNHGCTMGFSLEEASHAERVLLIGAEEMVDEYAIQHLRDSGCEVILINGDGTEIAHQLVEL